MNLESKVNASRALNMSYSVTRTSLFYIWHNDAFGV